MEKLANFLPKTLKARVVLAILIFLVIVGASFVIPRIPGNEISQKDAGGESQKNRAKLIAELQKLNQDSDSDGLKDWEEIVYKTDLKNPDTDGDGTNDGDEIKQSRNPLVKGPDDKLVGKESNDNGASQNPTQNLTNKLIQSNIIDVLQQGIEDGRVRRESIDISRVEPYIQSLRNDGIFQNITLPTKKDLTIVSTNPDTIRGFFNLLVTIAKKYNSLLQGFERTILGEDIKKSGNAQDLLNTFDLVIADLKKLPVPESYTGFALEQLINFARMKHVVSLIFSANQDPLSALLAIEQVPEIMQKQQNSIIAVRERLIREQVKFTIHEPGYIFTQLR